MNDETKRKALNEITQDINSSRLSRRGLLNRLKGMGVAFGAAVMLGVKESRRGMPALRVPGFLRRRPPRAALVAAATVR